MKYALNSIGSFVYQKCDNILEVLQKVGQNEPKRDYPVCKSYKLIKKIATANINHETHHTEGFMS